MSASVIERLVFTDENISRGFTIVSRTRVYMERGEYLFDENYER